MMIKRKVKWGLGEGRIHEYNRGDFMCNDSHGTTQHVVQYNDLSQNSTRSCT